MRTIRIRFVPVITLLLLAAQLLAACAPTGPVKAAEQPTQRAVIPATGPTAAATQAPATEAPTAMPPMTMPATQAAAKIDPLVFQQAMRKLWEDHITWTRVYIISAAAGLPDSDAAVQRLLQNQVDIGNAIKPYYGEAAGAQLTALLKDHITIAVDILSAAKAGDNAKLEDAKKRWYDNANQIAAFLNKANPNAWPLADMQSMMKSHLDLTLDEATARLRGDWTADAAAYDKVRDEILKMADMLSAGIIQQFPADFSKQKASKAQIDLTLAMDQLWEDHVQWTRFYIISAVADLPDAKTAATRLLQNQVDIGNAIKPLYGNAAGDQLTALLKTHITTAVDILTAAKSGDQAKLQKAKQAWYDNANQIAAFLNKANPDHWALADMQTMMKDHLDLTLDEATARLNGDWTGDVTAYDKVHAEILKMSGMLTAGILAQYPDKFK